MHYVNLINMIDQVFPSHGFLHPQLKVFVYVYALSPTTCALQIALYIPHTYYYQHMSFPTTLQNKETQLIINSSIDIRFDWFLQLFFHSTTNPNYLCYFATFATYPPNFIFLFLLKRNRSNLLAHSLVYLLIIESNCLIPIG